MLDRLSEGAVRVLDRVGNASANAFREPLARRRLGGGSSSGRGGGSGEGGGDGVAKPGPGSPRPEKERWVRAKYAPISPTGESEDRVGGGDGGGGGSAQAAAQAALVRAAAAGNVAGVCEALASGADPNGPAPTTDPTGSCAATLASDGSTESGGGGASGAAAVVEVRQRGALYAAAFYGHRDAVEALLLNGAVVPGGLAALAEQRGHAHTAAVLLAWHTAP